MKKFYVGVKGLVRDKNRGFILLGRDYKSGEKWALPGGRVDGAEDFATTLYRELTEELPGITNIIIGELLHVRRLSIDIEDNTSLALVYYLVEADLPETITLSDEHNGHTFVTGPDDMPEGVHPEVQVLLNRLLTV